MDWILFWNIVLNRKSNWTLSKHFFFQEGFLDSPRKESTLVNPKIHHLFSFPFKWQIMNCLEYLYQVRICHWAFVLALQHTLKISIVSHFLMQNQQYENILVRLQGSLHLRAGLSQVWMRAKRFIIGTENTSAVSCNVGFESRVTFMLLTGINCAQ